MGYVNSLEGNPWVRSPLESILTNPTFLGHPSDFKGWRSSAKLAVRAGEGKLNKGVDVFEVREKGGKQKKKMWEN